MFKDDNERLIAGALSSDPFASTTEVTAAAPTPRAAAETPPPLCVGVADFFATCKDRIEYVLDPFIPKKGFTLVAGPPKSGKTWFVAWLATQVAATGQGKVVFVEEEGAPEVLRTRLQPFLMPSPSAFNDTLRVVFRKGIRLDQPAWIEKLAETCSGAALIVLDPFVALHGQDENEQSAVSGVINAIQRLVTRTGAAVVLVHHTRKGGSWDRTNHEAASSADVRGSGALIGSVDCVISIRSVPNDKRVPDEVRFLVENPDNRVAAPFERRLACVNLKSGIGALAWLDEAAAVTTAETTEELLSRILLLLPSDPTRPLNQEKLRAGLHVKTDRMRQAIKLGRERKLIEATAKGLYKPEGAFSSSPVDPDPDLE